MSGYIGSKASVTLVDGYTQAEADAEFVAKAGDTMTGDLDVTGTVTATDFAGDGSALTGVGSTDYGVIGTYAFLHRTLSTETINQNSTYAGSGLHPAGVHHIALDSGSGTQYAAGVKQAALSGTWRAMGQNSVAGPNGNYRPATLFVRIS